VRVYTHKDYCEGNTREGVVGYNGIIEPDKNGV